MTDSQPNIEAEVAALLAAQRAVLTYRSFDQSARVIFNEARKIIGAQAGYVALLTADCINKDVLFLEAGGRPCMVDPNLPMPIRGLRAEAYKSNRIVYDNDFPNSPWNELLPAGHLSLKNVMFAPLVIENKTQGIIGLANKDGNFDDHDAHLAAAFGEFAAIALFNSRNLDKLETTIRDLESALQQVKILKGIKRYQGG